MRWDIEFKFVIRPFQWIQIDYLFKTRTKRTYAHTKCPWYSDPRAVQHAKLTQWKSQWETTLKITISEHSSSLHPKIRVNSLPCKDNNLQYVNKSKNTAALSGPELIYDGLRQNRELPCGLMNQNTKICFETMGAASSPSGFLQFYLWWLWRCITAHGIGNLNIS